MPEGHTEPGANISRGRYIDGAIDAPDVLIIGAGPAGLAAAAGLRDSGLRTLVLDQGKALGERIPRSPADLPTGVGGAGLFSDGKFSFFPSATALWSINPADDLDRAYFELTKLISGTRVPVPDLYPRHSPLAASTSGGGITIKEYPSVYMPLSDRYEIINSLSSSLGGSMLLSTKVDSIRADTDLGVLATARSTQGDEPSFRFRPKAIVLAMGRFGPTSCTMELPHSDATFRRIEAGFRIEQPADGFFLRNATALDPKLIAKSHHGSYGWRTFCCCRQGEILTTKFDDWVSVSGRADCEPTGRSSVGFNLRVEAPDEPGMPWKSVEDRLRGHGGAVHDKLGRFLRGPGSPLGNLFGEAMASRMREGLQRLTERFPADLHSETDLWGPTLEGVGYYPRLDAALRMQPYPIWVAGDGGGSFRGITAALVSGFFVSRQIAHYMNGSA